MEVATNPPWNVIPTLAAVTDLGKESVIEDGTPTHVHASSSSFSSERRDVPAAVEDTLSISEPTQKMRTGL